MAHQHDSSNIGKDIITTPSNGYDIGIKNVDYQERIVLRSPIYRYCLLIRSVSLVPLTAEFARRESPEGISAKWFTVDGIARGYNLLYT